MAEIIGHGDQPLPVLEKWAIEMADALAPMLQGEDRLRLIIGLIQARATECRYLSGEYVIKAGHNQALQALAIHLYDRAAKLEGFGMTMAMKAKGELPEDAPTKSVLQ